MLRSLPVTYVEMHDEGKIYKYFNEYIDIENAGFINVEKWKITMKQTGIKRYFILFVF